MKNTINKSQNRIKVSLAERLFTAFCYILVFLFCVACIYPIIYVVSASASSSAAVSANKVLLWPVDFTLSAYKVVFQYDGLIISFLNSVFYTVIGTIISIALTILAAYPLSKKTWGAHKAMNFFLTFTMWFGGGMIPFYMVLKELHLLDTRFGVLIYGAISTYYVIIFRTHFETMPRSLEEAAKIEGANDMQILIKIMIPLSKAIIAAISLYYAVGKWNSFFWESLILTTDSKQPLQVMLQRIIAATQFEREGAAVLNRGEQVTPTNVKLAAIVITTIPILVVYPFIQKYFVSGTLTGAVKG